MSNFEKDLSRQCKFVIAAWGLTILVGNANKYYFVESMVATKLTIQCFTVQKETPQRKMTGFDDITF
jgi:hypothetical protein